MILYQVPLSTYSVKVRLALAVKGVPVDVREPPGGSYRSEAYRALVPPATVPALVDGAFTLCESDAIIEYVDECHDGPALLPSGPAARAHARMLSRLSDLRLEANLRALFPRLRAGDPIAREDLQPAEQAWSLLCRLADPAGPWGCGSRPSLPDFGVAAALVWLDCFRQHLGAAFDEGERARAWRSALQHDSRIASILDPYRRMAGDWIRNH
jgi:glutathione S-transferase/maleylpyruvate isomerase